MELKFIFLCGFLAIIFTFNRTAYGIEMSASGKSPQHVVRLLIAPLMELKCYRRLLLSTGTCSFNRTAYGIEITMPIMFCFLFSTFNRTAYGIEILKNPIIAGIESCPF